MAATQPARVALLGLHHQSNALASETLARDFAPNLLRGTDVLAASADLDARLPIELGAFLEGAASAGLQPVPLLVASAESGGPVRQDAYEELLRDSLARLEAALPVDALLVSLNGAMVATKEDDPEGKLVA